MLLLVFCHLPASNLTFNAFVAAERPAAHLADCRMLPVGNKDAGPERAATRESDMMQGLLVTSSAQGKAC